MAYSLDRPSLGSESGGAVWDIWHADDARGRPVTHPIHDHTVYVNAALRARLRAEEGVVGWRFVQRAGDAVFIPCG